VQQALADRRDPGGKHNGRAAAFDLAGHGGFLCGAVGK
jgi:hypothetical protein